MRLCGEMNYKQMYSNSIHFSSLLFTNFHHYYALSRNLCSEFLSEVVKIFLMP